MVKIRVHHAFTLRREALGLEECPAVRYLTLPSLGDVTQHHGSENLQIPAPPRSSRGGIPLFVFMVVWNRPTLHSGSNPPPHSSTHNHAHPTTHFPATHSSPPFSPLFSPPALRLPPAPPYPHNLTPPQPHYQCSNNPRPSHRQHPHPLPQPSLRPQRHLRPTPHRTIPPNKIPPRRRRPRPHPRFNHSQRNRDRLLRRRGLKGAVKNDTRRVNLPPCTPIPPTPQNAAV